MNPATYLANTRHPSPPSPINFQETTNSHITTKSSHLGTLAIHSTSSESTLHLGELEVRKAPIHWLHTLEQKYNANDQSIYPSNITLFKLRLKKKEFIQFLVYLISHKDTLMKATSPVFINKGTEDLPYSLLYVPNGSHQGAYINLKEHLLSKVGSGSYNNATYCCSIDGDPGKLAVFRCGRFHAVPFSEIKIMSTLAEFEDYFVTGPCFNYQGSCAPRGRSDARLAGVEFAEEIFTGSSMTDPTFNREPRLKPKLKCSSIGKEILSKSTSNEKEVNRKQIVRKIGFVLDLLHGNLHDYIEKLPENLEQCLGIMVKIATCLHILHNICNVVHLDLKPTNIFLTHQLQPKLADFGLSAKKGERIQTGGAYDFRAPELVGISENRIHKTADYSADVWSFGVILIYLLGDKNDWQELIDTQDCTTNVTERYQKITEDLLDTIRTKHESNPIALKIIDVIEKCIIVEPEGRIGIYDALIELNQILKPQCDELKNMSPHTLKTKLEEKISQHDFKLDHLKEFEPNGYSDNELKEILSLCIQEKFQWATAIKPFFVPFKGQFFNGFIYIPHKPALYLVKAKSATAFKVNVNKNEPFINEFFNSDKSFQTALSRKFSNKEKLANTKLLTHPHMFVVGPEINFEEVKTVEIAIDNSKKVNADTSKKTKEITNKKVGFLLDPAHYKLSNAIDIPGKLSIKKIFELVTSLVDALKVLGDFNIVHCNLNPNCIWLSNNLSPRIADFRFFEDKGKMITDYAATIQFKAPEMYQSEFQVTSAIDVWGLGMILLKTLEWDRHPKFLKDGNFSYPLFLSNRTTVFKELKNQFSESWHSIQMIDLLEGCLKEEPNRRPTLLQLEEKLNSINTVIKTQ